MTSFEIGASRPVSAVQVNTIGTGAKPVQTEIPTVPAAASAAAAAAAQVETSDAVKAGAVPVDQERVETVRHAIETGKYPIIPARIADAMIAAGMLLRSPQ
ncbi:MAG: flagellar biosynthesis anti-sigma factor FlgM [Novosphingobium sp.]